MSEVKKMPKGGRKGGRQFPQINLSVAVEYAKRLVSKTHTSPLPESIVLKGVFDHQGSMGRVRASAVKQYGLMKGSAEAYQASDLAKKIASAPPEEMPALLREAALKPAVFNVLYETFKGDRVSKAKIRQQAASQEVHPDNLEKCVEVFVSTLDFAKIGNQEGEEIAIENVIVKSEISDEDESSVQTEVDEKVERSDQNNQNTPATPSNTVSHPPSGRSVIHVNIELDSSLDTEKLEKQLELLRKYGAI